MEIFLGDADLSLEAKDIGDTSIEGSVDGLYEAMPTSKWGNISDSNYFSTYVVRVTFMGKSLLWHKWAVVPLMKVQEQLISEGWDKKYSWSDLQTYCKRYIAGTKTWSNHSWPTAIDINPSKNPYGKKLITDIPSRVVEIFKKNGFKWGGDYKSVKDAMHFEYVGEPVKEYVTIRTLRAGMKGDDVTSLQKTLKEFGYNISVDGVFGPKTDVIVKSFQASRNLTMDGICGANTYAALKVKDACLKIGSEGKIVLWIQKVLKKLGFNLKVDGIFGETTKAKVKDFQKKNNLVVDGIIGDNTWKMLRFKSN